MNILIRILSKVEDVIYGLMLSVAIWGYMFLNELEYRLPNFFDPLPAFKKNEKIHDYCKRIQPRFAYRYTKYNATIYRERSARARLVNLNDYGPKDREFMDKLIKAVYVYDEYWRNLFHDAILRKESSS